MAISSPPDLLVRHALLLTGMADPATVARRFSLDEVEVGELLLDDEARGWVQRVGFADQSWWALTIAGRAEHSRRLAAEVADAGAGPVIAAVHREFRPLNARLLAAVRHWRTRPVPGDPLAANDHRNFVWDERVLIELHVLVREVRPLCERLESSLDRFAGYPERLAVALRRVDHGELAWIDGPESDSLHGVWRELRDDLLASLQVERGAGV